MTFRNVIYRCWYVFCDIYHTSYKLLFLRNVKYRSALIGIWGINLPIIDGLRILRLLEKGCPDGGLAIKSVLPYQKKGGS